MPKPLSPDLKRLESIMKLMEKFHIDSVELPIPNGVIKLIKTVHLPAPIKVQKAPQQESGFGAFGQSLPVNFEAPEEIMFATSSAPELTIEEFNNFPTPVVK